jgi:hydrogenase maturation protein HypF
MGTAADRRAVDVAGTSDRRRIRVRVEGTVQGVGFRPYVYRLASELGLAGHVLNDSRGVLVEVEADPERVERFLRRLPAEAPPLARVEQVSAHELPARGQGSFRILESPRSGEPSAPVTPDTATCDECLAELFDPADRRFRYPFINCTNCGPRFTIVRGIPYDRAYTTMARFEMCERCRAEYEDPANRRFHAEPNACPVCGPSVRLVPGERAAVGVGEGADPIATAVAALSAGAIVAVKGIGGFHLACRADDQRAVGELRSRKHREDKPFALMVPNLAAARRLVVVGPQEESLLCSHRRPIVLAPRRPDAPVAPAVAPGAPELGVMLPYSPLHHLLIADAGQPLVLTSGNVSDEPIAYRDEEALERLGSIADAFLLHDRPIHTRTDDSVMRTIRGPAAPRQLMLRRSRGYVPESLELPVPAQRHLLACGAELKNTFCLAKGSRAWVGHHVGDLHNYETYRSFTEGIEHFQRLFAVAPDVVVHDLHPEYLSTKYALDRDGGQLLAVQHHHAHLAACLAEHGATGPVVGAIYDGTGYGSDGTVWGGELLFGGLAEFQRDGMLWPVRLPGGEAAIRQPWRMACAWLTAAYGSGPELPATLNGRVEPEAWRQVADLCAGGVASPLTTSMGRLFDAVAAVCGIRTEVNYEGQAAVELEASCAAHKHDAYPLPLVSESGRWWLDARETVRAILADLVAGLAAPVVAARFHNSVAEATATACRAACDRHSCGTVVLSGGVFQNRRLLEHTTRLLESAELTVLTPERLPPNDGGIAYGQAAVAAARIRHPAGPSADQEASFSGR